MHTKVSTDLNFFTSDETFSLDELVLRLKNDESPETENCQMLLDFHDLLLKSESFYVPLHAAIGCVRIKCQQFRPQDHWIFHVAPCIYQFIKTPCLFGWLVLEGKQNFPVALARGTREGHVWPPCGSPYEIKDSG